MMSEKRFILAEDSNGLYSIFDTEDKEDEPLIYGARFGTEKIVDLLNELNDENDVLKQQLKTKYVVNKQYEELQRLREENKELRQERKRWKNLYEIKDAEVTARVDALNKVCEYYTSEVLFKSDVDPNEAVKEVINEILNTPIYEE